MQPDSQVIAFAIGKKEANYGVSEGSGLYLTWIPANQVDFPELELKYRDDSSDINGMHGATEREIESAMGKKAWVFQASIEMLAFAAAMQLGRTSVSGSADPWSLLVKWPDLCTINPPSFGYFHGANCAGQTGTFKDRKGVVIAQQTIEIPGRGPIKHSLALVDDGSITPDTSFSVPSSPTSVQKVLGSHAVIQLGPPSSLVNLSAAKTIRDCKITINSNPKQIYAPGSNVTTVDEMQFGDVTDEVDLTVKGDESSAIFGYYTSKTLVQFTCLIDPGVSPLRTWLYTKTNCHVVSCKMKPSGKESQLEVKLGSLSTSTDFNGPAQILAKTGLATWLVSAP
ncbi:MAG TPA: hypothetical protein VF747_06680 [Blastocatellia bacterium]|jgi:hypothetical protein